MKIQLWYFEYTANSLGIWQREWALTEEAAETAREDKAKQLGVEYSKEAIGEECGEYGDINPVYDAEVELTAEGLLHFANDYATTDWS